MAWLIESFLKTISYTQKSYVNEETTKLKSVKLVLKANEFVTPDGKKSAHDRNFLSYKVQMVQQVQQENILLLIINCHL
ncbi:leukocidin family pore-forming toxin [Staphylococcus aureus]